jgi:hypothetical protein
MIDSDPLIDEYYRLQPTQFTVLQSLAITQGITGNGICEQSLSLVLSTELNDACSRLYLSFRGVRNFEFRQPEWSQISIGHLEILRGSEVPNVSSQYLVRDPEQEKILWFECKDFDARVG